MNISVATDENSNPPIIVAAIEPNIESVSSGIMPRIVVSEAIITGRIRLSELFSNASVGSIPLSNCMLISSISTMQFLISIPTRPKAPTIAQKVNDCPEMSIADTIPTANNGMQQIIIVGLR